MNINTITRAALTLAACLSLSIASAENPYREIVRLRSLSEGVAEARQLSDAEHFTALSKGSVVKLSYLDSTYRQTLYTAPQGDFHLVDYTLSPNEKLILIAQGASPIYRHSYTTHYHLQGDKGASAILTDMEATRDATFSPNSKMLAFSSLNNLYLYDIATEKSVAITDDGEWNRVINGTTDWVYEEEFGFTRAYRFAPSSKEIAYLKFDESRVPLFEMMRYEGSLYNKAYSFKYPKAGDENSKVGLWVYDIASATSREIEVGKERDQYIPHFGYTPGGELYYLRLNRHQNHLEVVLVESGGTQRTIYEERAPQYIERAGSSTITFIDKERFIVREETSTGYAHLYLHSIKKGRIAPITEGEFEVTGLIKADKKRLYYTSTEGNPLQRRVYAIDIDGGNKQQISGADGYYSVRASRDMSYYIATYTTATVPPQTAIYNSEGELIRTLKDNGTLADALTASERPTKQFTTIVTERGDTLNAYFIYPRDFDATKRYPLLMTQYSGPGSQQVADRWSLDWEDALVDNGYIVLCADGRGTGYRGEAFKKLTYKELGKAETEDQLSVAQYAASLPYVDSARIGIYGWSYGGFMALNCALQGEGLFKMAIAVAPVTSWRYYDTIYTEVYNGLPQENPTGYDDNSPLNHAEKLSDNTRLLIIHGTADDNVHYQNSMEMAAALNREGKSYDMMIYPDQNHSMMPSDTFNVRAKMVSYTLENL